MSHLWPLLPSYLKGELPNVTTKTVENQIIFKLRGEMSLPSLKINTI